MVVDTSAWIEWFVDSDIGRLIAAALSRPERCIVPTIVQLELTKWALRELSEEQQLHLVGLTEMCQVELLDTETALMAASAKVEHKLALADAIIFATAQRFGAEVITCDAHFNDLPSVKFFHKRRADSMTAEQKTDAWIRWPTSEQMLQAAG